MKNAKTALVAVILSTLSGASLAAQPEGHSVSVQQPAVTALYVTGSTTLVSLDVQLSGSRSAPQRSQNVAFVSGLDAPDEATTHYH